MAPLLAVQSAVALALQLLQKDQVKLALWSVVQWVAQLVRLLGNLQAATVVPFWVPALVVVLEPSLVNRSLKTNHNPERKRLRANPVTTAPPPATVMTAMTTTMTTSTRNTKSTRITLQAVPWAGTRTTTTK
jgi:hypothetical protein